MASGTIHPSEASATNEAPLQHIDLPDDWRGDIEKPLEEWCPTCRWDGIWEHLLMSETRVEDLERDLTKSMLWSSASEGHICCAVLLAFLQKVGDGKYDAFRTRHEGRYRMDVLEAVQPENTFETKTFRPRWILFAVGSAPAPPGVLLRPADELPSLNTGSATAVAWARDRIHECCHNHSHSHSLQMSNSRGSYIPSRLLYIPPNPIEGIALRLKESVPLDAKYAALSYCWGSQEKWPRCLTTNANYESQLSHIPWDTLPQTFRDTAIFARELGVEYVWIDSMCIIQGDEKDWQRESTQMCSVYSNAYITFAALHGRDSHQGLFTQRAPGSLVPLLTLGTLGKTYHVQAYEVPDEHQNINVVQLLDYSPYPLSHRAWAFQERLVSPRVLFFGREELILQCPTELSCEGHPYSPTSWNEADAHVIDIERPEKLLHKISTIAAKPDEIATHWLKIIQFYNHLVLSNPTDHLPAIAAIAQRFAQGNPDDEYICGLWRNSIHQGLALFFDPKWMSRGPHIDYGPSVTLQSKYIAPSWSWASFRGQIYEEHRLTPFPCFEIVDVNLRHIDNDQYGRVAPGSSITLKGPVLDCVWDAQYQSNGTLSFYQYLSIPDSQSTIYTTFSREYLTYDGLERREGIKVRLLLLGTLDDESCAALILREIEGNGHYFRLGVWKNMPWVDGRHMARIGRALKEAPVRECVIE